ncbi:MAG: hypothetical protein AAF525_05480 [Pseudomonadota bacterium]
MTKRYCQLAVFLLTLITASSVNSASAWYYGAVKRISLSSVGDGSFVVTVHGTALSDCQYGYAYFDVTDIGAVQVERAYSLAMISLTTGLEMGFVIDKAVNGAGGDCFAKTADLKE